MVAKGGGKDESGIKLITQNRKARHNFEIEETLEAGMVLVGTEVKSCRDGKANLTDAYAIIKDGEAWLLGCHISAYSHGTDTNHEPERMRKLLLNRSEIDRLAKSSQQNGRTIVPLRLYFKHGIAKAELAIARGKNLHDKRQTTAKRDAERQMQRELGRRR